MPRLRFIDGEYFVAITEMVGDRSEQFIIQVHKKHDRRFKSSPAQWRSCVADAMKRAKTLIERNHPCCVTVEKVMGVTDGEANDTGTELRIAYREDEIVPRRPSLSQAVRNQSCNVDVL